MKLLLCAAFVACFLAVQGCPGAYFAVTYVDCDDSALPLLVCQIPIDAVNIEINGAAGDLCEYDGSELVCSTSPCVSDSDGVWECNLDDETVEEYELILYGPIVIITGGSFDVTYSFSVGSSFSFRIEESVAVCSVEIDEYVVYLSMEGELAATCTAVDAPEESTGSGSSEESEESTSSGSDSSDSDSSVTDGADRRKRSASSEESKGGCSKGKGKGYAKGRSCEEEPIDYVCLVEAGGPLDGEDTTGASSSEDSTSSGEDSTSSNSEDSTSSDSEDSTSSNSEDSTASSDDDTSEAPARRRRSALRAMRV